MKSLVLIRHAKSSWSSADLTDHDRPLNGRGKRDAPFMAQVLLQTGLKPDLLLSSTAKRAFSTACYVAEAFNFPKEAIDTRRDLYLCWYEELENTIRALPDDCSTVFVFNHNPTLEQSLFNYTKNPNLAFPTCAMAHLEADIDSWDSFLPGRVKLKAFYYPKQFSELQ